MHETNLEEMCRTRLKSTVAELEEVFDAASEIPGPYKLPPLRERMLPVFGAGIWLKKQLREIGLPHRDIEATCFAAGQCCTEAVDPWQVAETAINRAKMGFRLAPGRALAECIRDGLPLRPLEPLGPIQSPN